jgi:Holliday junction resolvase YEN1
MAKRLIRLFGFLIHDAPGEAEAECALLQQHGIVDAVLSEDVDTIMFGCTRTLRNWSSEGTKGSKTPTHVSMYDSRELNQGATGLDREGMVLVALMSGGDYLPEGIPGAGVKLACEAARAGFGKSLCQLKRADTSELTSWKEWLTYELRHNESGFFRTRHKALTIPDDFPNMDIIRYYTHPVVSPASTLQRLRQQSWDRQIDVQELREFVRETFDWSYRIGAIKFIRVLAPCLLVRKLMQRHAEHDSASEDIHVLEKEESELVKSITTQRAHFSTDATSELRISFMPTSIVGYDFQEEPDEVIEFGRDGLALNSDAETEELAEEVEEADSSAKVGARKPFSPTETDLYWVPEAVARLGIPLTVEKWEEAQRAKAVTRSKPKTSKQQSKPAGMATGALDKFVKVTKNNMLPNMAPGKATSPPVRTRSSLNQPRIPLDVLPASSQRRPPSLSSTQGVQKVESTRYSKPPTSKSRSGRKLPTVSEADASTNPWTIAGSQASPRINKNTTSTKTSEPILISSSPPASPSKGAVSSMSSTGDKSRPDPFSASKSSSQRKRRPITPPRPTINEADISGRRVVRELSPTPASSEKPQLKLARTESLPTESTPLGPSRRARGLARAQTVATEPLPLDSEDDDDFELPPLSSLLSQIPKAKMAPDTAFSRHGLEYRPGTVSERKKKEVDAEKKKQTTLKQSLGARMTKLYVPRKSEPGFFKEIDVSVNEVDALQEQYAAAAGNGGRWRGVWRQSDISYIDLTGED